MRQNHAGNQIVRFHPNCLSCGTFLGAVISKPSCVLLIMWTQCLAQYIFVLSLLYLQAEMKRASETHRLGSKPSLALGLTSCVALGKLLILIFRIRIIT